MKFPFNVNMLQNALLLIFLVAEIGVTHGDSDLYRGDDRKIIFQEDIGPNYKYVFTAFIVTATLILFLLIFYCREFTKSTQTSTQVRSGITARVTNFITNTETRIPTTQISVSYANTGYVSSEEQLPTYDTVVDGGQYPAVKINIGASETPPPKYLESPPQMYPHSTNSSG